MNYLEVLYFALPAFAANMAPVVIARLNVWRSLAVPIDAGKLWNGRPLLGKNKTWRGVVAAGVFGACIGVAQYALESLPQLPPPISNSLFLMLGFGAFVGVLCMLGDLVGSAIKRYLGIASGRPFIPLDQIDYMLAFLAGTWLIFDWSVPDALFLLVFAFFLNFVTNILSYMMGIKSTYW